MKSISINFLRSNTIESTHYAKVLIKNIKGKSIYTTGNDEDHIYPRSSIKIFQAIPFVSSGAIKDFKLNDKIIALSCSSHRGEKYHIKELEKWLKKIKIRLTDLKCGQHYPLNQQAKEKILLSNIRINQLYNNCAGKHLAMISSCIQFNYDIDNYLNFDHPHQIKIREVFEKFSESKIYKKSYGVDGCSAPQYSFKLKEISTLLVNLIKSYKYENSNETRLLINAVLNNPRYIGGSDSLDSEIIEISNKKIFCKGGAEGVFLFIDLKKDICGVIKIIDGNERAMPSLVFSIFKKLKILNNSELNLYKKKYKFDLFNHAKIKVGSIKTII